MLHFAAEMMMFEGTNIECRIWPKAQLAERLGVHRNTLYRRTLEIRDKLEELPNYNPRSKVYWPDEVRIILQHIGF